MAGGRKRVHAALFCLLVCVLAGGCSPQTDAEREYRERRRVESIVRESIRDSLEGGAEESEAIELVKESPAPDGETATAAWLQASMNERSGSILFPRWQAFRRGIDRYEVWFSYTFMAPDGAIQKKGYAWNVDLMLKAVKEPRPLTESELGMRTSRYFRSPEDEGGKVELIRD